MIGKLVIGAVVGLVGIAFIAVFISLPVWLLWNALLPDLFGFKTITWIQALGLQILSGFLFATHVSTSK